LYQQLQHAPKEMCSRHMIGGATTATTISAAADALLPQVFWRSTPAAFHYKYATTYSQWR